MINLLPNGLKEDIRAARTNIVLLRYIALVVMALAFIMGVLYFYYIILQNTMASAQARIDANDVKAGVYSATREEVEGLSAQLTEAKTVLDQDVSYANFLIALGQATPQNTVLNELTLDNSHFNGTPFELKGFAKTDSDAAALGNQLKSTTQLFTSVDIQSTSSEGGIPEYPIVVTMSVTLNKTGGL
tara:strand:+ start:5144 stop:5704 length:561 start_codon:yes stop_codon:yes gene_type:complete